jgi:tetratricopeptide (TPR) repeat protein
LSYPTIIARTEAPDSTIARQYVLRSFEAAIDALLAEATAPDRTARVEAALRKLVTTGNSDAADAILAEIADRETAKGAAGRRQAAAAIKNGVALAELPHALGRLMRLPNAALPVQPLAKTGKPLGQLALPAYRRAAELDPGDPWTWIVITWMTNRAEWDAVIGRALAAAAIANDDRAVLAALQLRGYTRQLEGRLPEAERSLVDAVRIAARGAPANRSMVANDESDTALGLTVLGAFFAQHGQPEKAERAYDAALQIRKRRATADPDNSSKQVDVIELHIRMGLLTKDQRARDHAKEAFDLYNALASRSGFTATLKPNEGELTLVFLQAGALTLIGGFILLALYRRRVDRLMKAASVTGRTEATVAGPTAAEAVAGGNVLAIQSFEATAKRSTAPLRSTSISAAGRVLSRAAWVYTFSGVAFAAAATLIFSRVSGLGFGPVRTGTIFLAWVLPTVLVLGLLWGRDRRKLTFVVGGYFGALLLLCVRAAAADLPPIDTYGVFVPAFFQPLVFWAITASPTLFLLLFLNRQLRSVGAVLFVFLLVASVGSLLAKVAISTPFGRTALVSVITPLHIPVLLGLLLVQGLGMALLALPAWWVIGGIRRAYQRKWLSDQTLVFDTIWLFQALLLSEQLTHEVGLWGLIGLSTFLPYKLVAFAGLSSLARAAAGRPIARVLLLRVFGFQRRAERLFDLLAGRWRYAGPIQMIAAPDLASSTIDPDKFMDFLSRRLRQRFIIEPADLWRRFGELDMRPDADGRFRVNEFFCGNDSWKTAVQKLMDDSELVVMDLRGFSPQKQGCLFELQSLLDIVPVTRFILLVDASTDVPFLCQTLGAHWERLSPSSPNIAGAGAVTLLDVSQGDVAAVDRLLEIADDVLAAEKGFSGGGQPRPPDLAGLVPSKP